MLVMCRSAAVAAIGLGRDLGGRASSGAGSGWRRTPTLAPRPLKAAYGAAFEAFQRRSALNDWPWRIEVRRL